VLDQVNIHKDPALADLRARNFADASFLLERHRMDVQECGGGLQIERVHRVPSARVAINAIGLSKPQ